MGPAVLGQNNDPLLLRPINSSSIDSLAKDKKPFSPFQRFKVVILSTRTVVQISNARLCLS